MKKFSEEITKIEKKGKKIFPFLLVFLLIVAIYIYETTSYVIIRFDELGPLTKNMSAYYNGFRIGKIVKIEPDYDYKHTLVRVNLTQKDLRLPQNTSVYVERFPNGELYLQFVYPQSPSLRMIKRGDLLEGIAPYSLEQFMMGQSVSGMSDIVSIHIIRALDSAEATNQEMKMFFKVTSNLIKQNNKGITSSVDNTERMTKNLAQTAENLNQLSRKLNNSIDETVIKGTTLNIKDTTESIANATKDIGTTMQKVDDTITNLNATAQNLNSITGGLNQTMGKRFAGIRILFGKPVK